MQFLTGSTLRSGKSGWNTRKHAKTSATCPAPTCLLSTLLCSTLRLFTMPENEIESVRENWRLGYCGYCLLIHLLGLMPLALTPLLVICVILAIKMVMVREKLVTECGLQCVDIALNWEVEMRVYSLFFSSFTPMQWWPEQLKGDHSRGSWGGKTVYQAANWRVGGFLFDQIDFICWHFPKKQDLCDRVLLNISWIIWKGEVNATGFWKVDLNLQILKAN